MEDVGVEESKQINKAPEASTYKDNLTKDSDLVRRRKNAIHATAVVGKAVGSFMVGPGDEIGSAILNPISNNLPKPTPIEQPAYQTENQATWRGRDLIVNRSISRTHTVGSQPPEPPKAGKIIVEQKRPVFRKVKSSEKPSVPVRPNKFASLSRRR